MHGGLPAIALRAPDGSSAVVTLHGAHVVSWIPAASQHEQLYLSPTSAFATGKAIRGGVPVVFPQFSDRGPLLRHGFARTRPWELLRSGVDAQGAFACLRLCDDNETLALWPHAFALELAARVDGNSLSMELSCHNTGDAPFAFTCALHTYLRVQDITQAQVLGLAGLPYWNAVDGTRKAQADGALLVPGELDRIYEGVTEPLHLIEPVQAHTVRLDQSGFQDVVVWNPGAQRAASLPDLAPGAWRNMLCIEAARIANPVHLAAGHRWVGRQQLAVSA
ncbi:MAG: D-hexose-6-phosphate mutarotase [Burkholderiaceae bacterium]